VDTFWPFIVHSIRIFIMTTQFEYFSQMNVDELTDYFSQGQEESERLEFKSGDCTIQKLHREVCALANTDGGVIIYGAPTETEIDDKKGGNKSERRKICIGSLSPTKEDKTIDSLNQMFFTAITPAVVGIKIKKDSCGDGFIYIIDVPKSANSPHQVGGTGIYYIRIGTMSMPAPHGIVEALFNKKPPIELEIQFSVQTGEGDNLRHLVFSFSNKSDFPAQGGEVFISLVGNINENKPNDKDEKFKKRILKNKINLSKAISMENSLVCNIRRHHAFPNFHIGDEYFYASIYFWAKDTAAVHRKYKAYKSGFVQLLNQEENFADLQEFDSWANSQ
jgi:hypothetical protein